MVTTHVYPGVRKQLVFLFLAVTCVHFLQWPQHRPPGSVQGFTGVSWVCCLFFWTEFVLLIISTFLHLLFSLLIFVPFLLLPVLGFGSGRHYVSGLSCRQYALPMTVSPKMALTFTTGLCRPFLAPNGLLISVAITLLVSGKTLEMLLMDVECLYL